MALTPQRHHRGLYSLLVYDPIAPEEVGVFLQALLRPLRGPRIVLWDHSSTPPGEPLPKLLARHPRLGIEHFPSYAPELNPDEGLGAWAKAEWANGCPKHVEALMGSIIYAIDGIRSSPEKRRGCILQSDLPLFLSSYCII